MHRIKTYKIGLILAFALGNFYLAGQGCPGYYKSSKCTDNQHRDFYMNGQSRSSVLEIGVTSQFEVVLKGGRDYVVTCCANSNFYPIHFTLINKDGGEVLYDNMYDDYMNSIGFTLENTQNVIISVTLLADGKNPEDFDDNRSCVGVAIQFRNTPRLGF